MNDNEANRQLTREYRKGFVVPARVSYDHVSKLSRFDGTNAGQVRSRNLTHASYQIQPPLGHACPIAVAADAANHEAVALRV